MNVADYSKIEINHEDCLPGYHFGPHDYVGDVTPYLRRLVEAREDG